MIHVGAKGSAEGTSAYFRKTIPRGRLGTVDELASAAVFLASSESSFITGIGGPVQLEHLALDGQTESNTVNGAFASEVEAMRVSFEREADSPVFVSNRNRSRKWNL
jgi:enoyl-ACP reductase-like protein